MNETQKAILKAKVRGFDDDIRKLEADIEDHYREIARIEEIIVNAKNNYRLTVEGIEDELEG
jgi:predicted  nucleic acid-binding Zn-ribbon protein